MPGMWLFLQPECSMLTLRASSAFEPSHRALKMACAEAERQELTHFCPIGLEKVCGGHQGTIADPKGENGKFLHNHPQRG